MENKDYIKNIDGAQRRFAAMPVGIEVRADDNGKEIATINGIAAKVNSRTDLNWFDEVIEDGHLAYSYDTPDVTYAKDLETNIRLGNVSQSSFAFTIKEHKWTEPDRENKNENHLRTIIKVDRLFDVSPVTYPAYQDTEVGISRSWSDHKAELEARNEEDDKGTPPSVVEVQIQINKNRNK